MIPPPNPRHLFLKRVLRFGAMLALLLAVFYCIALAGYASRDGRSDQVTLADLQAQVAKDPGDKDLTYGVAKKMVLEGDPRGAFPLMQRLVKQDPNSEIYWDGYARCAAANNDLLEAARGYRRVLQLNPKAASAHAYLGQIDIKAGLTTDGLAEIDTAHKFNPKVGLNVDVWTRALVEKGRLQEAYDAIVASINVDPTQDSLYPLLGRLAPKIHEETKAEFLLWRRVSVSAMYPVGYARCTLVRMMLAKSHDAKTLAEAEALAHDAIEGKSPDFYAALAEVQIAKNDLNGARKTLLEGLTYGKEDPACLRLLAKVAEKQGKPADAAHWRAQLPAEQRESAQTVAFRQAVAAFPEDNGKRMALAQELEKQTEYGSAAEVCLEILQRTPNDKDAENLLVRCREEAMQKLAQSPEVLKGKN